MSRSMTVAGILYVLLMAAIVGGLWAARSRATATLDSEQSRQQWEEWRTEAGRQAAGGGPVSRRTPKAAEPPTLLLLRDYFPATLLLALMLSSILFLTLAFMVHGVTSGPGFRPHQDDRPPSG